MNFFIFALVLQRVLLTNEWRYATLISAPQSQPHEGRNDLKLLVRVVFLTFLMLMVGVPMVQADSVNISVTPSIAPNAFGSPSWSSWVTNAIFALQNNLQSAGTAGSPDFYQAITGPISGNQILVTSFNSWLGQTNPGSVFGSAFANELGNRLHFGLSITSTTTFSVSELSFTMMSTDPFNALGFSFASGSYNYSSELVGVNAGADGILGTPDDVIITSGPNTQLVHALFGRGSGNAFWPCGPGDPLPCVTSAEMQAAINAAAGYPGSPYSITGTYSLNGFQGSNTVQVSPIPEPATLALFGTGLIGIVGLLKRRSRAH